MINNRAWKLLKPAWEVESSLIAKLADSGDPNS
jgi:hypothetical protein